MPNLLPLHCLERSIHWQVTEGHGLGVQVNPPLDIQSWYDPLVPGRLYHLCSGPT